MRFPLKPFLRRVEDYFMTSSEPTSSIRDERGCLKDEVFLRMALEISRLGTCCRMKVGAILLRPDGGVAAAGFNGALPGMPHCTPETCGPDKRCLHTSHAEENALCFCDGVVSVCYVTHEPCLTCTRALIRRGVRRVVFQHVYASIGEQERQEREAIIRHFGVSWEALSLT
jgi:dCMP deaminase